MKVHVPMEVLVAKLSTAGTQLMVGVPKSVARVQATENAMQAMPSVISARRSTKLGTGLSKKACKVCDIFVLFFVIY